MNTNTLTRSLPVMGVGRASVAAFAAVGAAVLLPQVFHMVGAAAGAGPSFAQSWLPMFLPVALVGLLAGPAVGLIVGLASPVVAFALTGMPAAAMLPGMIAWLALLGVVAGLVSAHRLHPVWATLLVGATAPVISFAWMTVSSLIAGTGFAGIATWGAYWLAGLPGLVLLVAAVGVTTTWIARSR